MIFNFSHKRGFTLIELLVAMGLFLVVLIIAIGAFVQSLRIERQAVELIAINDNASLTLEQIAREIRTGENFSRPSEDALAFTNYLGQKVAYGLSSEAIQKKINDGAFEPQTATNIRVAELKFLTSGLALGDKIQPRVTIVAVVGGKSKVLKDVLTILQTTISPRIPEE